MKNDKIIKIYYKYNMETNYCVQKLKNGKNCSYDKKVGEFCTRHYNIIAKKENKKIEECITITFGDRAENHVGMQKIGELADEGFTVSDLKKAQYNFEEKGYKCEYIDLVKYLPEKNRENIEASILIVRQGVDCLLNKNGNTLDVFKEQKELEWDSKAKMYGRVVNKIARRNLCYGDYDQKEDYDNGKGTIVSYERLKYTKIIKESLKDYFGNKAENLQAEGNYYYDITKTGIGYHGDGERRKVIAIRLGLQETVFPLQYLWFLDGENIGEKARIELKSSDLYIMSEKAVGFDWKKKKIPTLRHGAGEKYIKK